MANCTDCEKYTFCPLVENGDVDVYAEAKEKNCENFERESNMADNDRFLKTVDRLFGEGE